MTDFLASEDSLPDVDMNQPHPARMYDYYLGGKNHFAADRAVADAALASWPAGRIGLRENRRFLGRVVRYLAADAGIRQFLDIGSGLPTQANVHEIAQAAAPSCRVVYVDNDSMVLAHARALLASVPEGRTAYIQADLRSPLDILTSPVVREVIDFDKPVALMLVAVLHFLQEEDKPEAVLATLLDALPPGSYLAASHMTMEHDPEGVGGGQRAYHKAGLPMNSRDADDFASLAFSGLDLVPPGVVLVSEWRPDTNGPRPTPAEVSCYGGVARKPLPALRQVFSPLRTPRLARKTAAFTRLWHGAEQNRRAELREAST
jgi:hypothetical protein